MPRSRMHSSIVRERGSALLDDTSGRAFFRRVCVSLFCTRVCVLDVCVLFVSRVCHGSCVVALHGRARAARHARCLLCACCQLQSLRQAARGKRSARQRQRSDPARLRPCHAAWLWAHAAVQPYDDEVHSTSSFCESFVHSRHIWVKKIGRTASVGRSRGARLRGTSGHAPMAQRHCACSGSGLVRCGRRLCTEHASSIVESTADDLLTLDARR